MIMKISVTKLMFIATTTKSYCYDPSTLGENMKKEQNCLFSSILLRSVGTKFIASGIFS